MTHLCHPTMDFAVMHNAAGGLPYRVRPPSIILAMRSARFAIGGAAGSARGQRLYSGKKPAGSEKFRVGSDVAVTSGNVIYRNRLIEVIAKKPRLERR